MFRKILLDRGVVLEGLACCARNVRPDATAVKS